MCPFWPTLTWCGWLTERRRDQVLEPFPWVPHNPIKGKKTLKVHANFWGIWRKPKENPYQTTKFRWAFLSFFSFYRLLCLPIPCTATSRLIIRSQLQFRNRVKVLALRAFAPYPSDRQTSGWGQHHHPATTPKARTKWFCGWFCQRSSTHVASRGSNQQRLLSVPRLIALSDYISDLTVTASSLRRLQGHNSSVPSHFISLPSQVMHSSPVVVIVKILPWHLTIWSTVTEREQKVMRTETVKN